METISCTSHNISWFTSPPPALPNLVFTGTSVNSYAVIVLFKKEKQIPEELSHNFNGQQCLGGIRLCQGQKSGQVILAGISTGKDDIQEPYHLPPPHSMVCKFISTVQIFNFW